MVPGNNQWKIIFAETIFKDEDYDLNKINQNMSLVFCNFVLYCVLTLNQASFTIELFTSNFYNTLVWKGVLYIKSAKRNAVGGTLVRQLWWREMDKSMFQFKTIWRAHATWSTKYLQYLVYVDFYFETN